MPYENELIRRTKKNTRLLEQICQKTGTGGGSGGTGDASEATLQSIDGNIVDTNTKLDTLIAQEANNISITSDPVVDSAGNYWTRQAQYFQASGITTTTYLDGNDEVGTPTFPIVRDVPIPRGVYRDVLVEVPPNTTGTIPAGSVSYVIINEGTPTDAAVDPSTYDFYTVNGQSIPPRRPIYKSSDIGAFGTYGAITYNSQNNNLAVFYTELVP